MTATVDPTTSAAPAGAAHLVRPLRRSPGTELLGEYVGWAFAEPQHLIRRHDGQVLQVSELVFLLVAAADGERDDEAIAAEVREGSGRDVDADNVRYLVEHVVARLGVLETEDDTARLVRAQPLLAIRARAAVVPERFHRGLTSALRPLFRPPVVAFVLVALGLLDGLLLLAHRGDAGDATKRMLDQPILLLVLSVITWASMAFHEFGHATAARYGGARPGSMGVGFYLIWPALYTNVTDTYRLDRRGRLRTDLGGLYFNAIFLVGAATAYLLGGWSPLIVFIGLAHLQAAQQFLPFLRLDGYYVVSDLIGVPNLFGYVGPVLARFTHPRDPQARQLARDRLAHLKPRARTVNTVWVCATASVLLVTVPLLLVIAPRYLGTAWASGEVQWGGLLAAVGAGAWVAAADRGANLVLLAAPIGGSGVIVLLGARRFVGVLAGHARQRRPLPVGLGVAAVTAVALLAALTWPGAIRSSHEWAQSAVQPHPPAQPAAQPIAAPTTAAPTTDAPTAPVDDRPPAEAVRDVGPATPVTITAPAPTAAVAPDAAPGCGTGDRLAWMDEVACTATAPAATAVAAVPSG
jgi:putative peptide zinc metalloprotease protein